MVIFNSYVKLPEGICCGSDFSWHLGSFDIFDACLGRAGVFDLVGQILHAAIAETNVLAKDSRRIQNDQ